MRILRLSILIMPLMLIACMSEDQKTRLEQQASIPLTCLPGADCAAKWRRAYDWVNENSHFPILKSTDKEIIVDSSEDTFYAVVSVKMMPKVDDPDENSIVFTAECQNTLGCIPTELQLRADFAAYVNDTPEPKTFDNDIELGATFAPQSAGNTALVITRVTPGSPAATAGLQPGDRLVKFNGHTVTSAGEVNGMVSDTAPSSVVPVQIERSGKTIVSFMQL